MRPKIALLIKFEFLHSSSYSQSLDASPPSTPKVEPSESRTHVLPAPDRCEYIANRRPRLLRRRICQTIHDAGYEEAFLAIIH